MWSQTENTGLPPVACEGRNLAELNAARAFMRQALLLLDEFSISPAAASLDLAIHQLDREIAPPPPNPVP